jgi:hypothetical protein
MNNNKYIYIFIKQFYFQKLKIIFYIQLKLKKLFHLNNKCQINLNYIII